MKRTISFVVASNNHEVLQSNLLASPCLEPKHSHQILVKEGFSSAAVAYNNGIDESLNDLMVFVHQDIILPKRWLADLERGLEYLEKHDPNWGVIGVYGETLHDGARGYVYSSGLNIMGKPFDRPEEIQTLDEIVLIIRKSSGLRFDESLPNFHMYGTDICMTAMDVGRKNYAISAFCIHNTQPSLILGDDFYESYRHQQRKWRKFLPIRTTCVRITRYDSWMYRRKMSEWYLRRFRPNKRFGGIRATNPAKLMTEVEAMLQQRNQEAGEAVRLREVNA